jgi:hypothetical protein
MRLAEQTKIVHVLEAEDHAAGVDGDSVSLENYSHVTFIFSLGSLTGDAILKIQSGATAGTKTTEETFNYRFSTAALKAATGDLLVAEETSAALTITGTVYDDFLLVVEMDADEFTDGQQWITPSISSAASAMFASCVAILSKPRYGQNVPPTAIA